jgi:hypothetical protein
MSWGERCPGTMAAQPGSAWWLTWSKRLIQCTMCLLSIRAMASLSEGTCFTVSATNSTGAPWRPALMRDRGSLCRASPHKHAHQHTQQLLAACSSPAQQGTHAGGCQERKRQHSMLRSRQPGGTVLCVAKDSVHTCPNKTQKTGYWEPPALKRPCAFDTCTCTLNHTCVWLSPQHGVPKHILSDQGAAITN